VALDLPTQMGLDSDDPAVAGEVGKVGVAIDSLADIETLMDGIPLERISQVRTTANSIGYIWAAMFVALAEKRGLDPNAFGMFIQNDVLKEYIARGTQIFPPAASLRLSVDVLEYVSHRMPRWVPLAVSGYHIREAGADAVQEIAFTFANAICYVEAARAAGLDAADFIGRLSFFFGVHNDLFEEVAKFRAARRIWASLVGERFQVADTDAARLRFHSQTDGATLTAQQPLNNVVRVTLQALAAVLGGTQSLHTNGYDEALALPTEESAELALRTQQILAHESGVANTADPLGGSYLVERLTSDIEERVRSYLDRIEAMGGSIAAIEGQFFRGEIDREAYAQQRRVESGEETVVGVNRWQRPNEAEPRIANVDASALEARQVERLAEWRDRRDGTRTAECIERLAETARGSDNILPSIRAACEAGATVGEIADALRAEFGTYRDPAGSGG
jgi:methylmalonyl-CoA mutase N-terminal domain/subunit